MFRIFKPQFISNLFGSFIRTMEITFRLQDDPVAKVGTRKKEKRLNSWKPVMLLSLTMV